MIDESISSGREALSLLVRSVPQRLSERWRMASNSMIRKMALEREAKGL
jgi:hypothetical protein